MRNDNDPLNKPPEPAPFGARLDKQERVASWRSSEGIGIELRMVIDEQSLQGPTEVVDTTGETLPDSAEDEPSRFSRVVPRSASERSHSNRGLVLGLSVAVVSVGITLIVGWTSGTGTVANHGNDERGRMSALPVLPAGKGTSLLEADSIEEQASKVRQKTLTVVDIDADTEVADALSPQPAPVPQPASRRDPIPAVDLTKATHALPGQRSPISTEPKALGVQTNSAEGLMARPRSSSASAPAAASLSSARDAGRSAPRLDAAAPLTRPVRFPTSDTRALMDERSPY